MNIAIVGCGYWGPNFIRLVQNNSDLNLMLVCDISDGALTKVRQSIPNLKTTTDLIKITNNDEIEAVIVSTPVNTHYEICKFLLEAGKHVLCEKPITTKYNEAIELYELATKKDKLLMTGYTFLYNSSIKFLNEHLGSIDFGKPLYFNFVRTGLGPIREDINAMWDLAPHDISMLLNFTRKEPKSVTAFGGDYIQSGLADIVFIVIEFGDKTLAKIHLSWLDPIKTRKITVVGEHQMITFDDIEINEKIKIYDKGVSYQSKSGDFGDFQLAVRDGGIHIPNIKNKEPLKEELNNFIECIRLGKKPISNKKISCDVIKILEAAQYSLNDNNSKVVIN